MHNRLVFFIFYLLTAIFFNDVNFGIELHNWIFESLDGLVHKLPLLQSHKESKSGSLAPFRFTDDVSAEILHNFLRDMESEAHSLSVDFFGAI